MRSFTTELGTARSEEVVVERHGFDAVERGEPDRLGHLLRSASAQAFHRTSASSTCSNASTAFAQSTAQSTPVEKHCVGPGRRRRTRRS